MPTSADIPTSPADLVRWANKVPLPKPATYDYKPFAAAMWGLKKRGAKWEQIHKLMPDAGMRVPASLRTFTSAASRAIRSYRQSDEAKAYEKIARDASKVRLREAKAAQDKRREAGKL